MWLRYGGVVEVWDAIEVWGCGCGVGVQFRYGVYVHALRSNACSSLWCDSCVVIGYMYIVIAGVHMHTFQEFTYVRTLQEFTYVHCRSSCTYIRTYC